MRSSSIAFTLALFACDASSSRDARGPESLDIFATLPDAPTFAVDRRSFGVGVRSELRVAGDLGVTRDIHAVSCPAGECVVETSPSTRTSETLFLITPKVTDFHVHVDLEPMTDDETSSVDRVIHAEDGQLATIHPGAGPGVPFVEGMHVTWYFGTRSPGVAWDATRAKVTVTVPFEIVGEPTIGDGPDQDLFLRVEIAAPATLAKEAHGTLVVNDGARSIPFEVAAVPRRSITKLLIAPIPEFMWLDRRRETPFLPGDRVDVPPYGVTYAWLAFETTDGVRGIAGAGECLPAPGATTFGLREYNPAFYAFELDGRKTAPENQPYLELEGNGVGTSRLTLALGELEGSVDVVVGGGQ